MERVRKKKKGRLPMAAVLAALLLLLLLAAALWQRQSVRIGGERYRTDTATLDLSGTTAPDLSGLSRLHGLTSLSLDGCAGADLSALKRCSALSALSLRNAADTPVAPLAACAGLKTLDLTGTPVTAAEYDALSAALPDCAIHWDVPLSCGSVGNDAKTLTLPDMTRADADCLWYFPGLSHVNAVGADCYDALLSAERACPNVTFDWTVDVFGTAISHTETALDLSNVPVPDAAALTDVLLRFGGGIASVDLHGCGLSEAELFAVQDAFPDTEFLYTATLCGATLESDAAALDLSGVPIADAAELKEKLPYFKNLQTLELCDCGLDNETMGKLRADFPGIRFVWTVQLGKKWSLRTDTKYFSTKHSPQKQFARFRLTTEDIQVLQYCTELEALDLGHHSISDVSVLAGLKKLRILILADNRISDITPLAALENLEYAELFLCRITDLTPLAGLKNLKHLNVAHNRIGDLSPLFGSASLERLWAASNGLSRAAQAAARAALPNCTCEFDEYESTGAGWREHEIYFELRELFQYS